MSLFRISLAWSSYCLLALAMLPPSVSAKQNFGYPNTGVAGFGNSGFASQGTGAEFGVGTPSFPDTKAPGFTDHSSMSPDSWSAPPTVPVPTAPVFETPVATPQRQPVLQNAPSQSVQIQQAPTQAPALTNQYSPVPFGTLTPPNQSGTNTESSIITTPTTPDSVPAVGQTGNNLLTGSNLNGNDQSYPLQKKPPALLTYDSQNALSNSEAAQTRGNSKTPNVPNLQSGTPFKLAKTQLPENQSAFPQQIQPDPNSGRVASLQTGLGNGSGTSQAFPPQASPANVLTPSGASYQDILASQQNSSSNLSFGTPLGQQFSNQPGFQQFSTAPIAPNQTGSRYPLAQSNQTDPLVSSIQGQFQPQPQVQQPWVEQSLPQQAAVQPQVQHPWIGQSLPQQAVIQPNPQLQSVPNFRPDLGFRSPTPTIRHRGSFDNGQKFDFENKKEEYPPLSEILKTGRYFGSVGVRFVRPHFQNNTGITTASATFVEGITLDHNFAEAPHVRFGFESKFGPGVEFDYFKFNEQSEVAEFTSPGTVTGQVVTSLGGGLTEFGAFNAGETLSAQHTINFETASVSFFKEIQLRKPRINGKFGIQYVSIAQNLDATLVDATGEIGTFNSRSDFRGFGPQLSLEYYRPIGHTKLEFVTTTTGGVAFGRTDEFVDNPLGQGFSRAGADELLANLEFTTGVQFKRNIGENRSIYGRLGTSFSTFWGGGTANNPQSDFGLRGFTLDVGYNR